MGKGGVGFGFLNPDLKKMCIGTIPSFTCLSLLLFFSFTSSNVLSSFVFTYMIDFFFALSCEENQRN